MPWFGQTLPADWEGTSSKLFCVAMEIETSISSSFSCVFFWGLAFGGFEWVAELQAVPPQCFPIPLLHGVWVYLFSHQTSRTMIFHYQTAQHTSSVQFCPYLCIYTVHAWLQWNIQKQVRWGKAPVQASWSWIWIRKMLSWMNEKKNGSAEYICCKQSAW